MLETIINPDKAERNPWELFFIGLVYGLFSVFLVDWLFLRNPVFTEYSSVLIITFAVMLCTPFVYYTMRYEEQKDVTIKKETTLIKEHGKALLVFLFLFLGMLVAFSLAYVVLPQDMASKNFKIQTEQYCSMNMPDNYNKCIEQYLGSSNSITGNAVTSSAIKWSRVFSIFENNIFVLIFCLLFSLAFGSGAIFVLTWNASVIAVAIGIFAKSSILGLPMAFLRYMLHGLPEITAYFIAAIAGGLMSVDIIRHGLKERTFWRVLADSLNMIIIAIVVLFIAALMEVFITPNLF